MQKYRPVSSIILSKILPDEKKFLIVRKPRKNNCWQFPQGGVDKGETYLEAAERELQEECGETLRVKFLSNKFIGQYRYKFPNDFMRHDKKYIGATVKFFRGILTSGEVEIDNHEIIDYKWVKQEELKDYFEEEYLEAIKGFLKIIKNR